MNIIIELRVTPPFERPNEVGVLARLTVPNDPVTGRASMRARRYQSMDWIQNDPRDEWEGVAEQSIDAARAQVVHAILRSARLPPLSSNLQGMHETAYQLKVYHGRGFCEFSWSREAPSEWHELDEVAQEVRAIADAILGVDQIGGL